MKPYLRLLKDVLERGRSKPQRAVLSSTGERPDVLSLFGEQCRYDLTGGRLPLLTTKKMPFLTVLKELLWFISGSDNNNDLKKQGVHIWDEWADPVTGALGPVYGRQWRRWRWSSADPESAGSVRHGHWDQLAWLIGAIKSVKKDPNHHLSRRLILSSWHPPETIGTRGSPPYGCHTLAQFDVWEDFLSCHLYQRSADLFLGVPFNVACYGILTHLIARLAGLEAFELVHSFGDVHIYPNHVEQVKEQLSREPYDEPRLEIDLDGFLADGGIDGKVSTDRFVLKNYVCHGPLRGEVLV